VVLRDPGVDGAGHDTLRRCSGKERGHCHWGLVTAWFRETTGIRVPEPGEDPLTQLIR